MGVGARPRLNRALRHAGLVRVAPARCANVWTHQNDGLLLVKAWFGRPRLYSGIAGKFCGVPVEQLAAYPAGCFVYGLPQDLPPTGALSPEAAESLPLPDRVWIVERALNAWAALGTLLDEGEPHIERKLEPQLRARIDAECQRAGATLAELLAGARRLPYAPVPQRMAWVLG